MSKLKGTLLASVAGIALSFTTVHAASKNGTDLLKYIPADSPYVFAALKPLPDKVADKFEPTIDEVMLAYQRVIRHSIEEELAKNANDEGGADDTAKIRALLEEVLRLMSIKGIREAGVQRDSLFAVYGNGLLPVLRLGLSDMRLFDQTISRIEDKAEQKLSIGTIEDESYKYLDLEGVRLVIATIDGYAIMTVVPAAFDEAQLAAVVGLDAPRKNLAKSREIRAIRKEYGFTDYFIGFIDNERLARSFIDEPTGLNQDLLAIFGHDAAELSKACKTEYMDIAGIAPRMVFGYTKLNDKYIDSEVVVELRADIAKGLATLPSAIPGLGLDYPGLLSIGVGLNPLAARQFYEARLDAMEADPYECDKLAGMQAGVAAGREALNKPVPPVAYNFRGVLAVVSDIQGMDVATQQPPESIDASLLFAIENAQDLVTMAAMMNPEIAAMNLLPDGVPVMVEMAQFAEFADIAGQAFAALTENGLSVAVGEGAEANAAKMLVADSPKPAPLMSMSMDIARYYGFVGDAMAQGKTDEGEKEMPKEVRDAMKDAMVLMGKLYKRMYLDVRLTSRGVEMGSRITLAD